MPLIKSGSKAAIKQNIREMMHAGHPQKQAVAAAMSTARKYGKRAEGGRAIKKVPELPPIKDEITQLLKDQETAKLYDQVRNYIFPPEALLARKGIFPGTSADTMEVDASDLARLKMQGANPWWSTKSYADGGEVEDVTGIGPTPSDLSPLETIGRTARQAGQYISGPFQQFSRSIGMEPEQRQAVGDMIFGKPTAEHLRSTLQSPEAEAALGMIGGIRAYHASPHDFERFDVSKVGSGQGAQTYGHGLYFAENPDVAHDYYKEFMRKIANYQSPEGIASHYMELAGGDRDRAAKYLQADARKGGPLLVRDNTFHDPEFWNEALTMLKGKEPIGARRYQVNVGAEPERFLDWDRRLSEQHPDVTGVLGELGYKPGEPVKLHFGKPKSIEYKGDPHEMVDAWAGDRSVFFTTNKKTGETKVMGHTGHGGEYTYPSFEKAVQEAESTLGKNMSGETIYRKVGEDIRKYDPNAIRSVQWPNMSQAASELLSAMGVPGIKYLDQGSRFSLRPMIYNVGSASNPRYSVVDPKTGKQSQAVWDTKEEAQREIDQRIAKQTRNFVVFDPEKTPISIERKYARGGEAMSYADTARRYAPPPGYQTGGGTPWFARQEARNVAHGPLSGSTMGRADKLPINVHSGAYVVPADVVSGFGQGNSNAGMLALGKMFSTGPLGMPTMKGGSRRGVVPSIGHASRIGVTKMKKGSSASAFADGGDTESDDTGQTTPIAASDGEFIIHPQKVLEIGGGNLKRGHDILDAFVIHARKQHIKAQQKLPEPAKS